jgi:serine/threonine protein kinase/tetratricopeptide (TPR) repeat protein
MSSQVGQVVAERFVLQSLAGEGGMGAVYRALDRETGNVVALKVVHAGDEKTASRFAQEAAVLRSLDHPSIVRYVAHGITDDATPFLAMEWLDGEDLADRLARGPLSSVETVALVAQVADALGAAHARGVVHRDVKPSNIFLPGGDPHRVKILDFGIARAGGRARITTSSGGILGTLGYMAPEQARAERDVDARADVFSLGCVLHECITGEPVFQGDHVMAILAKILFDEAPRLRDRFPTADLALDALTARMLSKDPKKRPADGAALAKEILALSSAKPSTVAPPSSEAPSLTRGEQRLLCVVVAGRIHDTHADTVPIQSNRSPDVDTSDDALHRLAVSFEARIERLLDGSIVATLVGRGNASDQATRAARFALLLRALVPRAPMALATGRGEVTGAFPMGEVIDRAAALVRKARGDEPAPLGVRLDDVTSGLLNPRFEVVSELGGLVLMSERESRDTTRTLLGKPTPCVGREREIDLLVGTFDECIAESAPRVVLVTAASGVGKSRVRSELLARLSTRADALELWEGRGDPMSAGAPFVMIAPLLRRAAGLHDGEVLDARRQKLAARVARHVARADAQRVTEFLGELIGTPFPQEPSAHLRAARGDAIVMGDQVRRAFTDFLAAETSTQPVVIVLEDLHWGDLPSVTLLDAALRAMRNRPWMILALARPEVRTAFPDLWTGRGITHIELRELSSRASMQLVRDVLGAVSDETTERIVTQAAGNAFYLEELIRAVAEGRGDGLPETVLAMVQARLEALEPDTRRTLRAASVFGEVFWRGAVAKLLAESPDAAGLAARLDDLAEKELISRQATPSLTGKIEYVFRHAVVREAAYAMLTDGDRVLGHKLAGEWLEACGDPDAMLVAEHLERGEERARAVAWYRRASEEALAGNDFDGALARATRGMECGAEGETKGALHLTRCDAHAWKSDHAASLTEARDAAALFASGSEQWFKAVGRIMLECRRLGRIDEVLTWSDTLLASWHAEEASRAAIVAACLAADTLCLLGRPAIGSTLIDRIDERLARDDAQDPFVLGHVYRVRGLRVHFRERDPSAMATWLERSIAAFDAAGDTRSACVQRANRGFSLLPLGDYEEGERELRAAMETASRLGLLTLVSVCEHNLGTALGRRGQIEEAIRVERSAVDAFSRQGDVRLEAASRAHLAALELDNGSPDAARKEAERSVELARALPGTRAHALATLARIYLSTHDAPRAMQAATNAHALLLELGALEGSEELVRLVYAEAFHAVNDHASARAAITDAHGHLLSRANRIASERWRATFLAVRECARTLELAARWTDTTTR